MLFFYKNKGILIPVYFIVPAIGVAIISALLKEAGGIFAQPYSIGIPLGFAMIVSALWTYATRDSFYYVNGQKKRMFEDNTFFFIPMLVWSYIFSIAGVLCIVGGLLETLELN